MSASHDDAAPIGGMPSGNDLLQFIKRKGYEALVSNNPLDKETIATAKLISDIELKQQRMVQDDKNAGADREQTLAIAHMLKQTSQNPFSHSEPIPEVEPPKAEGPLADNTVTEENMSTELGSPSYDDVMGGGEDEES